MQDIHAPDLKSIRHSEMANHHGLVLSLRSHFFNNAGFFQPGKAARVKVSICQAAKLESIAVNRMVHTRPSARHCNEAP